MSKDEPGGAEWRERIKQNASDIYVREHVDGRWKTVALADLAPELQERWIERWASEGRDVL